MGFTTGDVMVWRSTSYYDLLYETLFFMPGLHCGVVLVGESFARLSSRGESPSRTYVTFLVDEVYPIEEVIGHVWHRPNGASLSVVTRRGGPVVPERVAYAVVNDLLSMTPRPYADTVYIATFAFLRFGDTLPATGVDGQRWNLCSVVVGYILRRLGLVSISENNLLPQDFYDCQFGQTARYETITLFDKETYRMDWLVTGLLAPFGHDSPRAVFHPVIDKLMRDYDYAPTRN